MHTKQAAPFCISGRHGHPLGAADCMLPTCKQAALGPALQPCHLRSQAVTGLPVTAAPQHVTEPWQVATCPIGCIAGAYPSECTRQGLQNGMLVVEPSLIDTSRGMAKQRVDLASAPLECGVSSSISVILVASQPALQLLLSCMRFQLQYIAKPFLPQSAKPFANTLPHRISTKSTWRQAQATMLPCMASSADAAKPVHVRQQVAAPLPCLSLLSPHASHQVPSQNLQ